MKIFWVPQKVDNKIKLTIITEYVYMGMVSNVSSKYFLQSGAEAV